jgi:hypothetical protein
MPHSTAAHALTLTEEEAFALLDLAMTSSQRLDAVAEAAMKKLAAYCSMPSFHQASPVPRELDQAG